MRYRSRGLLGIAGMVLALAATARPARGDLVTPVTYDMPNGQGQSVNGAFNYLDETYNGSGDPAVEVSPLSGGVGQLVDGVVGADDWSADLGNGPAFEWVAWKTIEPTITFDLGAVRDLVSVGFFANNNGQGGVALFAEVDLTFSTDGVTFGDTIAFIPDAAARADQTARFFDIAAPRTARYVRASFSDGAPNSWIFLAEARFDAVAVPEPASLALLAVGAAGLGLAAARRRR